MAATTSNMSDGPQNAHGTGGAEALARFRSLVDQAPVAMMLVNTHDFRVEFANRYYLELAGKTEEIIGQPLFDYLPEDYGKHVKQKFDEVLSTHQPYRGSEVPVSYRRNGSDHHGFFDVVYQPMLESNGQVTGIMVVVTEVTTQVIARQKLETSEQNYHNMINSAPSAIAIITADKLILTAANDAMLNILGKGPDIVGKPYFEMMPELIAQGYPEIFQKILDTGEPFFATETPVTIVRDGTAELQYYNFVLHAQLNFNGEIEGVGIMATEVTKQAISNARIKENADHFRLLADLMPAKISNAKPTGEVIYYNKQWLDYSGMSFGELRDFGYYNMMHPDEIAPFREGLQYAAETGNSFESEIRIKNIDGVFKWHRNIAAPIKDEVGNIQMWVGVTTEIQQHYDERELLGKAVFDRTRDLERANSQLSEANTDLVQANKRLESFVYVSSHDLQEPLRKIQTFTGLLLKREYSKISENGKHQLQRVIDSAARMKSLIEDLLVYSRAGNEGKTFEKQELVKILDQVRADLDDIIDEKKAVIETDELCAVAVDPSQFRQVLHNLVGNALKFSFPGRAPHIMISSKIVHDHASAPGKTFCKLSIADNGIGFDSDYSDRIFEVFQRLHSKDEYEGTGIGLAIVKKIIEYHNGFVEARGKPGEGAVFEIWLPVG